MISNVIASHENDLLRVHPLLNQKLVGVVCISLMSIVVITTAACYDYGPIVSSQD